MIAEAKVAVEAAHAHLGRVPSPASSMPSRLCSDSPYTADGPLSRDPETLRLLTQFAAETDVGLRRVDEVLIDSTRTPITRTQLEELAAVFCVVSRVANLVDAPEMRRLARATESVLQALPSSARAAHAGLVEILFEASLVMRELLEEVWAAAIEGRTFVSLGSMDPAVARIEAAGHSLRAATTPRATLAPSPVVPVPPLALEPSS